jgi:hypothetical protein
MKRVYLPLLLAGLAPLAQAGTPSGKLPVTSVVQEPESDMTITAALGYHSEYIFRGVDLIPGADGIGIGDINVSKGGFTLGLWYAHMFGEGNLGSPPPTVETQQRKQTFSSTVRDGEGTAASPFVNRTVTRNRFTTDKYVTTANQTIDNFDEFDIYLNYSKDFGDFNLTVGNVLYIQQSEGTTYATQTLNGKIVDRYSESFSRSNTIDRVFARVGYNGWSFVQPSVLYSFNLFSDRSEAPDFASYLEFKLASSIPLVADKLSLDPYVLVSYNFKDRQTVETSQFFTDWNHVQAGVRVPYRITDNITLAGVSGYSKRITDNSGDDEFFWGGAELSVSF